MGAAASAAVQAGPASQGTPALPGRRAFIVGFVCIDHKLMKKIHKGRHPFMVPQQLTAQTQRFGATIVGFARAPELLWAPANKEWNGIMALQLPSHEAGRNTCAALESACVGSVPWQELNRPGSVGVLVQADPDPEAGAGAGASGAPGIESGGGSGAAFAPHAFCAALYSVAPSAASAHAAGLRATAEHFGGRVVANAAVDSERVEVMVGSDVLARHTHIALLGFGGPQQALDWKESDAFAALEARREEAAPSPQSSSTMAIFRHYQF